ncbi:MAG: D-lyxose/D-mannose family sugar isomerase [Chitinivibrionales bacterium]
MKRSQINEIIRQSIAFFDEMMFRLPKWGYWSPQEWKDESADLSEITETMLGWDLTDFGAGDFSSKGLVLFTIRNGRPTGDDKPYAEKIMIVEEQQQTPMHFHWRKVEDIINRGGGNLILEIYGSTKQEHLSDKPVIVQIDGIPEVVQPGGKVVLSPGQSICLRTGVYHKFYGEPGKGRVLVGEVSSVNDDISDNRFFEPQGRFPFIEQDEEPDYFLVTDYQNYLNG